MNVIEIVDVTVYSFDSEHIQGCSIDLPSRGIYKDTCTVAIEGWVLGRRKPVALVEVLHEDVPIQTVPVRDPRPDVAANYSTAPRAEQCGFWIPVGVISIAPKFELHLVALLEDGNRVSLGVIRGEHRVWDKLETGTQHEESPVIIYGAPRSGTTYLTQILNKHPEIFISNEVRLFAWVHQSLNALTLYRELILNHRDQFIDHLYSEYPLLIRKFYRNLDPQARIWGDKNPHYASSENRQGLHTIAALFPRARFINIIRDGRDVVTSLMRKQDLSGRPWAEFEAAHNIWTSHVDIGREFGKTRAPSQYYELRYEDLIRDDISAAQDLLNFLKVEVHPDVIDFCRVQLKKRTPLGEPSRELDDVEKSYWSSTLTLSQQWRSLELLGKHLVQYGFETESSLISIKRRLGKQLSS